MATIGGPDDAAVLTLVTASPLGLVALGAQQPAACVGLSQGACDAPSVIAWTSTDGTTWTEVTGSDALRAGTISDVATGPDAILAVGDQGWSVPAIWRSTDGVRWDAEVLPVETFGDAHLFGVTSFAGGWVVTGMTGGHELHCCDDGWRQDETQPAAWWSADGVAWERAETPGGASEWGARLGDVFAAPGGLVAVDDGDPADVAEPGGSPGSSAPVKPRTTPGQPQLWTSADGHAWTPATIDAETAYRPIASDGTAVLGRSTHGDLATSTDGITWRTLDAQGSAPGSKASMEWGYMRPAWLVPDGLLAVGLDAAGGPTRRLVLATATTAPDPASPIPPQRAHRGWARAGMLWHVPREHLPRADMNGCSMSSRTPRRPNSCSTTPPIRVAGPPAHRFAARLRGPGRSRWWTRAWRSLPRLVLGLHRAML